MAARLCCPAPRKPVDIDMYLVEWRQHLANDMDSGSELSSGLLPLARQASRHAAYTVPLTPTPEKQSGSKSGGGGSTSKGSGKGSKKKVGEGAPRPVRIGLALC